MPKSKADHPIGGLIGINGGNLLLYVHGATHRSINGVDHHEQRIAPGVDDPAAVLVDRWIDQPAAKSAEPFERANVIQSN
jgi:hypothetical protein